ncbi:hypothetical protein NFI96_013489 [Prochilodus magdalenae]|nr:hypothetical protein NFI96_013489 [Prochilodus magdalenae]
MLLVATCHINPHSQASQGMEWEVLAIHPLGLELAKEGKGVVEDSVVAKGIAMGTGMGMGMDMGKVMGNVKGMDTDMGTDMDMDINMASMGKSMERASIPEALAVTLIRECVKKLHT